MAEIKFQGIIIGLLTMSLFLTLITFSIVTVGNNYDTTGYEEDDIGRFVTEANISSDISEAQASIETVTVDKNLFDYLAGIFNAVLTPFKVIYRTFGNLIGVVQLSGSTLKLWTPVTDYLVTVITVIVVIGLVLIKYYMGKQK